MGVIRVQAKTITYAISRKGAVSRVAEFAQGVVTGNAPSVNKLRELTEQEIMTWRESNKLVQ